MAMAARVSKNRRAKNMHGSCTFSFVVDGSSALYAAIAAMISPVLAPPTPSARPRRISAPGVARRRHHRAAYRALRAKTTAKPKSAKRTAS